MRTILLSLLVLLPTAGRLSAQYFTRTFQPAFYNRVLELLPTFDGTGDVVLISHGDYFGDQSFQSLTAIRMDTAGAEVHRFRFSNGSIPYDLAVLVRANDYIAMNHAFECDIYAPLRLARFDESGQVIWTQELDPDFVPPQNDASLLPGPGDDFWVFRQDDIAIRFNAAGEIAGTGPAVELPPFRGYLPWSGGRYLTFGDQGLARYDAALVTAEFALPGTIILEAAALPGGRIAALGQDSLYLLDSVMNVLQTTYFSLPYEYHDLAADAAHVWLLQYGFPLRVRRYTHDLTLEHTDSIWTSIPYRARRIQATAGRLFVAGEAPAHPGGGLQVVTLRAVTPTAPPFTETPVPDAASTALVATQAVAIQNGPYVTVRIDSLLVTVLNNGAEPLHTVTLNSVVGDASDICPEEHYYRKTFTGLGLAPGASMQLPLDSFNLYFKYVQPQTVIICVWTTRPNDSLDQEVTNNSTCIMLPVTTGLTTPVAANGLSIAPNPAAEYVAITLPADVQDARLELYSSQGRLLLEMPVTGAGARLERGQLPAGMYYCLVRQESGRIFSGRVCWQ